jgi:hypothetical protein
MSFGNKNESAYFKEREILNLDKNCKEKKVNIKNVIIEKFKKNTLFLIYILYTKFIARSSAKHSL